MSENIIELKDISSARQYLDTIVDYHIRAVPEDYMPSLGKYFLRNVLYKGAIKSNNANIYIYMENNNIAGYVIYSYDFGRFLKEILLKGFAYLLITAITKIVFNRRMLKNTYNVLVSVLKEEETIKSEAIMIVVDTNYRGRGIGNTLFHSMYEDLREKSIREVKLRVLVDNLSAIKLYKKSGWEIIDEINFLGRKWFKMKKELI